MNNQTLASKRFLLHFIVMGISRNNSPKPTTKRFLEAFLAFLPILVLLTSCHSAHFFSLKHKIAHLGASEEKAGKELGELVDARKLLLESNQGSSERAQAIQRYNQEMEDFFFAFYSLSDERNWGKQGYLLTDAKGRQYKLFFSKENAQNQGVLTEHLQRVRLAQEIALPKRIWGEPARDEGVGIALVADYADDALGKQQEFAPEKGFTQAITALIDLPKQTSSPATSASPLPVFLELYSSQTQEQTQLGKQNFPLQRNLSAPLPSMLKRGLWENIGLEGLFKPITTQERRSLYQLTRGNANKVPVIFVHGLGARPVMWRRAINTIMADPVLQKQYQPLYFAYPTGLPIIASAAALREELAHWRKSIDPTGENISSKHAILVGHSMGGLISRMQVIDSGEHFREAFFQVPLEQMEGAPEEVKHKLQNSLYFKANKKIDSVIFIAAPHRGSELAQLGIVDFALSLAKVPSKVLENLSSQEVDLSPWTNPELKNFRGGGIDGVSQLEPGHPFYTALNKPKIQVPHHSIIGKAQVLKNPESSSDLVIPYSSSHLPTATSEDIIQDWHLLAQNPKAVAAIKRILQEYAKVLPD